jgi:xanthine dehydrogenase YagS FAD-binding subunit
MGTLGGNLVQRPRCWYFRNRHVPCWRKGGRKCFAFRGENKYHTIMGKGPCYAVHPSDPAVALLALDASVVLTGPEGERTLPLAAFYRPPAPDVQRANGYHPVTVLAPDELITDVVIPRPEEGTRSTYVKMMERGDWDFALVSVAVRLRMSGETVAGAKIALGGVATIPWLRDGAAEALVGEPLTEDAFDAAADAAVADARPLEHNGYKVDLLKGAIKQALRALI